MTRRTSLVLGALLAVVAVVAAVSLNVLLLAHASAGGGPVGRLTPRTQLPAAPQWTVRPIHEPVEDGGADD